MSPEAHCPSNRLPLSVFNGSRLKARLPTDPVFCQILIPDPPEGPYTSGLPSWSKSHSKICVGLPGPVEKLTGGAKLIAPPIVVFLKILKPYGENPAFEAMTSGL